MCAGANLLVQCVLGIQCRQFTMLAADQQLVGEQSVLLMRDDVDKLHEISDKMIFGVNGEAGDAAQFIQLMARNLQLYQMRNRYELDRCAAVHFVRNNLSVAISGENAFTLNLLVGSYDGRLGGQLHTLDCMGSCLRVSYAAHGLGGLLAYPIMDRYYRPDMTEPEAYELLRVCVRELQVRLVLNLRNFAVKVVSKRGIRTLPSINPAVLIQK